MTIRPTETRRERGLFSPITRTVGVLMLAGLGALCLGLAIETGRVAFVPLTAISAGYAVYWASQMPTAFDELGTR